MINTFDKKLEEMKVYKYKLGDIVKHKVGGPKMMIVSLAFCNSDNWFDWEAEDSSVGELGYLCRFFIPKSADIKVANALASGNYSHATANASGQGSYETKNFLEFELTEAK